MYMVSFQIKGQSVLQKPALQMVKLEIPVEAFSLSGNTGYFTGLWDRRELHQICMPYFNAFTTTVRPFGFRE